LNKISYIEVPEKDADKVMNALNGSDFKGRDVRCNDAEDSSRSNMGRGRRGDRAGDSARNGDRKGRRGDRRDGGNKPDATSKDENKGDWRQFFKGNDNVKFKDEEPDFSEEGWARRKPRKK